MKDNYQHISAEVIAEDDDFIRLVQGGDANEQLLLEQWLTAHPDQKDKLATARALVLAVDWPVPQLSPNRKARLWDAIAAGTEETTVIKQLPRRNRWVISIAAAITLLLVAGWWYTINMAVGTQLIVAAPAEMVRHILPDESVVSLNAVSELTYDKHNWQQERSLQLKGEAFFEVKKGAKFQVHTTLGIIEVLGTSFNVEERKGQLTVHCYTGRVRVSVETGESIVLEPQESVRWSGGELRKYTATNEQDIAWQQQLHHFDNVSLPQVLEELERQFGVSVSYPASLANRNYTGFFRSGNLNEALQAICWPMNLNFNVVEDAKQVVITTNE
jgi:ferric-dicitrate binding protein FerR (iron transport regulator)